MGTAPAGAWLTTTGSSDVWYGLTDDTGPATLIAIDAAEQE